MTSYPKASIPAIPRIASFFLGSICAVVALVILVEDALKTGTWSLEHKIMPAIVLIAIVSGKLIWDAFKRGRIASFAGFGLVFGLATLVIVYTSVGRQGASVDDAMAAAKVRADRVAIINQTLAKNQGMLADAEKARAVECGSGAGKLCNGKAVSVQVYKDAIKGNLAELKELGPEHEAAPLAERSAALLSESFGVDKVRAKRLFVLWQPVAFALLFELGAIVSFGYSFAGSRTVRRTEPNIAERSAEHNRTEPNGSAKSPNGPPKPTEHRPIPSKARRTVRRFDRTEAEADLVTLLAMGRTIPTQQTLVERWGVSKSTVSDWLKAWDADGLTRRTTDGKSKSVKIVSR